MAAAITLPLCLSAQEEEIPELEIDVDELLDMETDEQRGERVKVSGGQGRGLGVGGVISS